MNLKCLLGVSKTRKLHAEKEVYYIAIIDSMFCFNFL